MRFVDNQIIFLSFKKLSITCLDGTDIIHKCIILSLCGTLYSATQLDSRKSTRSTWRLKACIVGRHEIPATITILIQRSLYCWHRLAITNIRQEWWHFKWFGLSRCEMIWIWPPMSPSVTSVGRAIKVTFQLYSSICRLIITTPSI